MAECDCNSRIWAALILFIGSEPWFQTVLDYMLHRDQVAVAVENHKLREHLFRLTNENARLRSELTPMHLAEMDLMEERFEWR